MVAVPGHERNGGKKLRFSLREQILVSGTDWRSPLTAGGESAVLETPLGRMAVIRSKSAVTPCSSPIGGPMEDWTLLLGGDVACLRGLCAPYVSLHRKVRLGVDGVIQGRPCRLSVARSFRASRRVVRISFEGSADFTEFRPSGLNGTWLESEECGASGDCHRRTWQIENLDRRTMAALAFFELGRLRFLLDNPMLALL
ncbi:hypothetical protein ACM614_29945 [Streptomyces sp. 12297]